MTFDEWFNEFEVFSLRSERFHGELLAYKHGRAGGIDAEHLVKWLKAAYNVGYAHRNEELMDDGK